MLPSLFNRRVKIWLFILLPLWISIACTSGSPTDVATSTATSSSSPTAASISTQPGELTIEQDLVFGPGALIYTDTRSGLAELSGYQATLTLAFDGTRGGQGEQWSQTYVMLATNQPQARQWTIEQTGGSSNPRSIFLAELGGVEYERRGELECTATEIQEGAALADRLELASFLTGVIGAEEAGSATVNGMAADHYTFDQRALGEQDLTEATGEMWVASEGGYIVRYLLTTKAGADYFGEGLAGTMTLSYELTDSDNPVKIELPADCPPGMVDAPLLPDASNLEKMPGTLTYNTSTSLAEASAFYEKQMPALGWVLEGEAAVTETTGFLNYKMDNQSMVILITTSDNETTVSILLDTSQE